MDRQSRMRIQDPPNDKKCRGANKQSPKALPKPGRKRKTKKDTVNKDSSNKDTTSKGAGGLSPQTQSKLATLLDFENTL